MTIYLFENDAKGQLETAIGTGDTTLELKSGEGAEFPSPGSGEGFYVLVYEGSTTEWMLCTARSSDDLTVTRDASPSAFGADSYVELRLNDTVLESFIQKDAHREVTTDPDGSLAANYTGEEVYQSVSGIWWKHCTGTTWKVMNSEAS